MLGTTVSITLLIALPALGLVAYLYSGALWEAKSRELLGLAGKASELMTHNLGERAREVRLLANQPVFTRMPLDSADLKASLALMQKSYPHYSWIGLADLDGRVRVATEDMLVGQNVKARPWYAAGRESFHVGDLHEAALLGQLLANRVQEWPIRFIDFSLPVQGEEGQSRAVLGFHINWTWAKDLLGQLLPAQAREHQVDLLVMDRSQAVLYPAGVQLSERDSGAVRLPEPGGVSLVDWGNQKLYLTAVQDIGRASDGTDLGWRVVVRQPKDRVLAEVASVKTTVLIGILVLACLTLILAWRVARFIGKPIEQMATIASALVRGDKVDVDLPVRTREIGSLRQSLQDMQEALQAQRNELDTMNRELEVRVGQRTVELTRANAALETLVRKDALTGLANRVAANEWLAHEFSVLKRYKLSFAVLCMDIDFFKKVNDTYGHAAGDDVLKHVAGVMQNSVRETDRVARVGGEEFLVILPLTTLPDALWVAEKIRANVEASAVAPVGRVTMSIGVSVATPEDLNGDAAVQRADEMLYAAKHAGRNCVKAAADHSLG